MFTSQRQTWQTLDSLHFRVGSETYMKFVSLFFANSLSLQIRALFNKEPNIFFSPMYIIYWVFVFSVFSWPPSLSTFDMNSWNCIIRWMCFLTARQWNATQMNITIFKTHSPFFCCLCFFRKIRWWWKKNERNNNITHKHLHTSFTFCVAHVSGEFNMPKKADKRTKPKTTRAHTHIHKP